MSRFTWPIAGKFSTRNPQGLDKDEITRGEDKELYDDNEVLVETLGCFLNQRMNILSGLLYFENGLLKVTIYYLIRLVIFR